MEASRETDFITTISLFKLTDSPDTLGEMNDFWFYNHSRNGILIGEPYTFDFLEGKYSHQWRDFCPSTSYEDAMFLVQYFHKSNKPITITNTLNSHGMNWFVKIDQSPIMEAETMPLAICKAILKR